MGAGAHLRVGALAIGGLLLLAGGAAAQARTPAVSFLVINQEQILTGSQRGRALLAEEEAAREKLRGEARATDAAFEAEEQQLTQLRATLPLADFRAKAEDFDKRVVAARGDQDAKSAKLVQEFDAKRRQFYGSVAPILVRFMERSGALAVFDEASVLLADQSLVVTDEVIAEIDALPETLPSGASPPAPVPAPAPSAEVPPQPGPAPRLDVPAGPVLAPQPAPGIVPGLVNPAPRPRPAAPSNSQPNGE